MIERPFSELVASLAERTPTPAGGAAAGMAAAMGSALLLMVVRFSRGKKSNLAREGELAAVEQRLLALHAEMLALAERDCQSFAPVAAAYHLPQATAADQAARQAAIDQGLLGAMVVPQETLRLVREALATVAPVAAGAGKSTVADLLAGGELLCAAAEIAIRNLRVNAALVDAALAAAPVQAALASATALRDDVARQQAALRVAADRLLG